MLKWVRSEALTRRGIKLSRIAGRCYGPIDLLELASFMVGMRVSSREVKGGVGVEPRS